ncbi:MAG: hypothetical protein PHF79_03850, partial [Candidatus Pacebacteria bacterium]|nr:hypothetical protein [Candidatus Paceibacterota bacterium]
MFYSKSQGFTLLNTALVIVAAFVLLIGGYFLVEKISTPKAPDISQAELGQTGSSTDIRYVNNSPVTPGDKVVAVTGSSTGNGAGGDGGTRSGQAGPTTGSLTFDKLKNTKYGSLVFVNGKNDQSFHCSIDGAYWSDLNADGKDDAVVVVGCVGAGYQATLYPVLNVNDQPSVLSALMYGHNNNPHGDFDSLSISKGVISVISDARFQNDKHTESFVIRGNSVVSVGDSSLSPTSWDWKKYVGSGISFQYPDFLTLKAAQSPTFAFPTGFIPHTNFVGGNISVGTVTGLRKDDCLQAIPQSDLRVENQTINGIPFMLSTFNEGAAG